MRFVEPDDGGEASRGLLGLGLEKNDVMGIVQTGVLGLVVLLSLLFVVRPLAMRLSENAGLIGVDAETGMLGGAAGGLLAGGAVPSLLGAPAAAMLADESMIDMANIEGQIKASSMRKLIELVDKHPDESLSIMRAWMNTERA
jgi:flagellar M-ring protein FliF